MKENKFKLASIFFATLSMVVAAFVFKPGTVDPHNAGHMPLKATESITLDASHAPTTSTSYVETVSYTGIEYATYTFTKVKASTGNLATLNATGTLTKDAAKGLISVRVDFTGSLKIETWFTAGSSDITSYALTVNEVINICGNFFKITALSETTIKNLSLVYLCDVESHGHDYIEGIPFLNGDDYDRIDTCSVCGHEKLVEMVERGTYRTGQFHLAATQATAPATFGQVNDTIYGVTNPYLYHNPSAQWNNRLDLSVLSNHEAKNTWVVQSELNRLGVKYFSFDLLARPGSSIRLYGLTPSTSAISTHNYIGLVPGQTIQNNNPGIKLYHDNLLVNTFEANVWYKVVVDYSTIVWPVDGNAFTCVEIGYTNGDVYLNDARYYRIDPTPEQPASEYLVVNKVSYDLYSQNGLEMLPFSKQIALDIDAYFNNEIANDYVVTIEDNPYVELVDGMLIAKDAIGTDSLTLTYTRGDVVLNTAITVDVRGPEVHDGSEFDVFSGNTPTAGFAYTSIGSYAGKTGVYKASATASAWQNQLDVKKTSSNNSSHSASYANLKAAGISYIAFDMLFGTGSSATRLQSRTIASGGFNTNFIAVGQKYTAFNNGTFNENIDIYYHDSNNEFVKVDSDYLFQANVWYTVVVDISYVLSQSYTGGGYMNVSVTAPMGEIYLTNVTYYCPMN